MSWTLAPADLRTCASLLQLWTEKEGLLSRVAHDLCIRAEEANLTLSEDSTGVSTLVLEIPIQGLRVQGQVKRGQIKPLSTKDHAEIESSLQSAAVFDAARFPHAIYRGTLERRGDQATLKGELELRGQRRSLPLSATWREVSEGVEVSGEVTLRQSAWGIAPFKAMLGAIKVKDELRVSWRLLLREAP
ncbi:MAG: YceI family protein [Planctomycetes bacterium]|nr:YceI family protein [Planctomycetota bacterium]